MHPVWTDRQPNAGHTCRQTSLELRNMHVFWNVGASRRKYNRTNTAGECKLHTGRNPEPQKCEIDRLPQYDILKKNSQNHTGFKHREREMINTFKTFMAFL